VRSSALPSSDELSPTNFSARRLRNKEQDSKELDDSLNELCRRNFIRLNRTTIHRRPPQPIRVTHFSTRSPTKSLTTVCYQPPARIASAHWGSNETLLFGNARGTIGNHGHHFEKAGSNKKAIEHFNRGGPSARALRFQTWKRLHFYRSALGQVQHAGAKSPSNENTDPTIIIRLQDGLV